MTGRSAMRTRCNSLLIAAVILACGVATLAQSPTYNLGTPPAEGELKQSDAPVGPDGQGLPPGKGTAKQGATVWLARNCGSCHGPTGVEGPGPRIAGPRGVVRSAFFAPMIWNTINQMMPLDRQLQHLKLLYLKEWGYGPSNPTPPYRRRCCLEPDEVYSLTAYLLHSVGLIGENDVMDEKTLAQVVMPHRENYVTPPYMSSPWRPGMRLELVKKAGRTGAG